MSAQKIKARRVAILGPSECGKSFLASGFTMGQWAHERRRSIVFDPWKGRKKHAWSEPTDWGVGGCAFKEFDRWKSAAQKIEGCCVVWDEGTGNGGRDRENVALFTEIRHNHPVFLFLGHRYDAMLPVMRSCLTDLIIARCDPEDVEPWARAFADRDILRASSLEQYEFLWKRSFQPVRVVRFTPGQITAGIRL